MGSVELVFSTRSIEYSFVRACFRQCFLGRSGLIFVLRAVGNRCKMTFLRAAPMMVCAVPSVRKKCHYHNLCLLFAKFDPLWSQINPPWSHSQPELSRLQDQNTKIRIQDIHNNAIHQVHVHLSRIRSTLCFHRLEQDFETWLTVKFIPVK